MVIVRDPSDGAEVEGPPRVATYAIMVRYCSLEEQVGGGEAESSGAKFGFLTRERETYLRRGSPGSLYGCGDMGYVGFVTGSVTGVEDGVHRRHARRSR